MRDVSRSQVLRILSSVEREPSQGEVVAVLLLIMLLVMGHSEVSSWTPSSTHICHNVETGFRKEWVVKNDVPGKLRFCSVKQDHESSGLFNPALSCKSNKEYCSGNLQKENRTREYSLNNYDHIKENLSPAEHMSSPSERLTSPFERLASPAEHLASPSQPISSPSQPISSPSQPISSPSQPISSPSEPVSSPAAPISSPGEPDSSECFMCSATNFKKTMRHHLLFGAVECKDCFWSTNSCEEFKTRRFEGRVYCHHEDFQWTFTKIEKSLQNAVTEKDKEILFKFLGKYLRSTRGLEHYNPWKEAYNYFQEKLEKLSHEFDPVKLKNLTKNLIKTNTHTYSLKRIYPGIGKIINIQEEEQSMDRILLNCNLVDEKSSRLSNKVVDGNNDSYNAKINKDCGEYKSKKLKISSGNNQEYSQSSIRNSESVVFSNSRITKTKSDHKVMYFGLPRKNDFEKTSSMDRESTRVTSTVSEENNVMPRLNNNFVLTKVVCNDCPNCLSELEPTKTVGCVQLALLITKCLNCGLHVCFDCLDESTRRELGIVAGWNNLIEKLKTIKLS